MLLACCCVKHFFWRAEKFASTCSWQVQRAAQLTLSLKATSALLLGHPADVTGNGVIIKQSLRCVELTAKLCF